MSSVARLLGMLRERGIELRVDGDRLHCAAAQGTLTAELAERIREHKQELIELLSSAPASPPALDVASQIPRAAARERYPLSPTQRRNLYAATHGPGLPAALRVRGALDLVALREALSRIVSRHAPLRSVFHLDEEPPTQSVRQSVVVDVPLEDLSSNLQAERELDGRLRALSEASVDLVNGPPFVFRLFRLSQEEHVLFVGISQMVFDGWSFDVFLAELQRGYTAITAGEPWPLAELAVEYADYVEWKRRRIDETRESELAFWRERLKEDLPPAPLPTDRPRPIVPSYVGESVPIELDTALVSAARRVARERGSTFQMVLLAGLVGLMSRLGAQRDVVLATPIDGRAHPNTEVMLGAFINLLVLRVPVTPTMSFGELIDATREVCLSAYEHQEQPVDELGLRVRRGADAGFVPLWQLEFSFQQVSTRSWQMGPLTLEHIELHGGGAPNELTFWLKDTGHAVSGAMVYALDLFDRETIEHWLACYQILLADALEHPERAVSELDLLGAERARVEAAGRLALSSPPGWWGGAQQGEHGASEALCVIDDRGQPVPLGVWGRLSSAELPAGDDVRLTAAGRLERKALEGAQGADQRMLARRSDPVDVVELRLMDELADALGLERVGLHDSFFDLGGHSLVGVKYLERVSAHFGAQFALGTLFEAPTPYALARLVRAECAIPDPDTGECARNEPRAWTSVVNIQPRGQRPPVFAVAGIGGNPMNLRHLARHMGEDQPFYGLQHRGTDGRAPPHESVASMAAEYVEHIRAVQPQGPYYIGGFSAGGIAALEVARRLRAEGDSVGLVFMLDANSSLVRTASPERRWEEHKLRLRQRGARYPVEFVVGHLRTWLEQLRLQVAARLAKYRPYRFRNEAVTAAWSRALRSYDPAPYDGDVLVLRARTRDDWTFDETNGWGPLVRGRLEVVEVEGGHTTHVDAEHSAQTAAALRERLDRARLPALGSRPPRPADAARHSAPPPSLRAQRHARLPRVGREPAGA